MNGTSSVWVLFSTLLLLLSTDKPQTHLHLHPVFLPMCPYCLATFGSSILGLSPFLCFSLFRPVQCFFHASTQSRRIPDQMHFCSRQPGHARLDATVIWHWPAKGHTCCWPLGLAQQRRKNALQDSQLRQPKLRPQPVRSPQILQMPSAGTSCDVPSWRSSYADADGIFEHKLNLIFDVQFKGFLLIIDKR